MRQFALAALALVISGCATQPDIAVLDSCLFEDEYNTNRERWTATPAPDEATQLLALGAPGGNPRRFYWFLADDGRVTVCQLHRYGSDFVIYSSTSADARVLDRGGAILLTH